MVLQKTREISARIAWEISVNMIFSAASQNGRIAESVPTACPETAKSMPFTSLDALMVRVPTLLKVTLE